MWAPPPWIKIVYLALIWADVQWHLRRSYKLVVARASQACLACALWHLSCVDAPVDPVYCAQLDAALVAADARWHLQRSYQVLLAGGRAELFFFDTCPFVQKYYEAEWADRVGAHIQQRAHCAHQGGWSHAWTRVACPEHCESHAVFWTGSEVLQPVASHLVFVATKRSSVCRHRMHSATAAGGGVRAQAA